MTRAIGGSARFAIWFGVALIALGLISLLSLTYYFLILLGAVGAASAVAGMIALARIRSGHSTWLDRHVGLLACVLLAAVSVMAAYMTGVEHEVVHEMTWEVGPPAPDRSSRHQITLHFEHYPGYHLDMYSDDLLAYLDSLPTRQALVTFVVTTDFGHMRGFRAVKIGDRAMQPSWAGAYGSTGSAGPSPFHAWE